jgi:Exopolyphosphatase
VRSARAVGEQYFYDRTHSRAVTEFALCLFDALRGLLDLDDKDRLLLEVASVLHDIGSYVSERRHERHSAYLIRWSNIVGLNENDRVVASQIAFYHRGELPSSEHPGFTALSREERIRVSKLAGILRMADVLDRGHAQDVRALRAEVQEDKLVLYLEISGDLGIIQDALPRKSDLLSRVTGLPIVLHREMPRL